MAVFFFEYHLPCWIIVEGDVRHSEEQVCDSDEGGVDRLDDASSDSGPGELDSSDDEGRDGGE